MTDRLLEIEKRLGITITMPQICHFCGEEIVDKFGNNKYSLVFHSLDGNHSNWDPENKVPAHRGHHMSHHSKYTTDFVRHYGKSRAEIKKKFQLIANTKMIIIPKTWIDAEERRSGKKMAGVHLEMLNGKIELTPMWEEE